MAKIAIIAILAILATIAKIATPATPAKIAKIANPILCSLQGIRDYPFFNLRNELVRILETMKL